MENQHRRITGYRDLSQAEIDLMNKIKSHAIATELLLQDVAAHTSAQFMAATPSYKEPTNAEEEIVGTERSETPEETIRKEIEMQRLKLAETFRWQAIAKTHLQEGTMALVRAVAQPATF